MVNNGLKVERGIGTNQVLKEEIRAKWDQLELLPAAQLSFFSRKKNCKKEKRSHRLFVKYIKSNAWYILILEVLIVWCTEENICQNLHELPATKSCGVRNSSKGENLDWFYQLYNKCCPEEERELFGKSFSQSHYYKVEYLELYSVLSRTRTICFLHNI